MELLLIGAAICAGMFIWALAGEMRAIRRAGVRAPEGDRQLLVERLLLCAEAVRELQELTGESRAAIRWRASKAAGVDQPRLDAADPAVEKVKANALAMEMICEIAERRGEPVSATLARLGVRARDNLRAVGKAL